MNCPETNTLPQQSSFCCSAPSSCRDQLGKLPEHLPTRSPYPRGRRASVSAESFDQATAIPLLAAATAKHFNYYCSKTSEQKKRIYKAIENNFMFKSLDDDQSARLVDAMTEKQVRKGQAVIEQGAEGDFYFIVESGTFDCLIDKKLVAQYGPGGSFGELALLHNAPRAATIISTTDGILWALDRITFRAILMTSTLEKRSLHESFLSQVTLLKSLQAYELHKIADALERVTFNDESVVMQQGEAGRSFYIIEDGEAVITKQMPDGTIQEVNRCRRGDYFGELALLHDKARAATVKAVGQLKCVTLNKDDFNRLLGPIKEILKRNSEHYRAVLRDVQQQDQ